MAHHLVLVVIPELGDSVVRQVWKLMRPHCGDPAGDELRFDFFTIGGRCDQIFAGLCEVECYEVDHLGGHVRGNVCRMRDLPSGFDPSSVVTPDGQMYLFEDLAVWRSIRAEHRDGYVVAVDAHW
jgi:hypothetical protein